MNIFVVPCSATALGGVLSPQYLQVGNVYCQTPTELTRNEESLATYVLKFSCQALQQVLVSACLVQHLRRRRISPH